MKFLGSFGGGKRPSGGGLGSGGGTGSAAQIMKQKLLKGKNGGGASTKIDYASMIQERLQAKKSELLRASAESKSASFKAAVDQMINKAEKKARKEMRKKQQINIQSRNFSNGRIDSSGNIYNSQGQLVMKVDMKTGVIKSPGGMNLGKYDPSSGNMDCKMSGWIDKYSKKAGVTGDNIWGNNSGDSGGSIWGTGGNPWGHSGGDNNSGGGWW